RNLHSVWSPVEEEWARLQRRHAAIAVPLTAWPLLAKDLPQTKALVAALKLCPDVAPLGQPLTLALATGKDGLAPLVDRLGKLEAVCHAYSGVPAIATVLASATPSRFAKWPERDRQFGVIADTLGQGSSAGLAQAVTDLAALVALANDAALDVGALQTLVSTL